MRATQTEQQVHRVVATYIQVIITVLLLINMKYAHDLHALNAHSIPMTDVQIASPKARAICILIRAKN